MKLRIISEAALFYSTITYIILFVAAADSLMSLNLIFPALLIGLFLIILCFKFLKHMDRYTPYKK